MVLLSTAPDGLTLLDAFDTFDYDHKPIITLQDVEHLVIEQPPYQGNDPKLMHVYGAISRHFISQKVKVSSPMPGRWKPTAKSLKLKGPKDRKLSRHQRDAYFMALVWWRWNKKSQAAKGQAKRP